MVVPSFHVDMFDDITVKPDDGQIFKPMKRFKQVFLLKLGLVQNSRNFGFSQKRACPKNGFSPKIAAHPSGAPEPNG